MMKSAYPSYLGLCSLPLLLLLVSHCGGDTNRLVATNSGGDTGIGGSSLGGGITGGRSSSAATGTVTGGAISTLLCSPGITQACLGPGQCAGAQACNITGTAWSACDCGMGTGGASAIIGLGGASASGGVSSSGGANAAGGVSTLTTGGATITSTGGIAATGGTAAVGGATTLGGTTSTGGKPSTGGALAIGGTTTTGGVPSIGGSAPTGGTNSIGGSMVNGGAPTTGGAPSTGVCGNGIPEPGEACDSGPQNGLFYGDGTGCSKTCTKEPTCRNGDVTGACSTTCGDGNIDLNEACDDGNQLSNDGCSSTCKVETGFSCTVQQLSDAQPCPSNPSLQCLVLPVTYRDFDGQEVAGGHPDFFYYGAPATGGRTTGVVPGANTTTCVPDAAGTRAPYTTGQACPNNDQTGPCSGLVQNTLGGDGKPVYSKGTCPCIFTDWDNTGVLGTCPASGTGICTATAGSGGVSDCWVSGVGSHHLRVESTVTVIQSADSFKQWYADSSFSTKVLGTLELAAAGSGQYQFSSSRPGAQAGTSGRSVYDDLHDICLATPHTGALDSGFFPLESQPRQKVCNIWPYWKAGLATNCCAGSSCPVLTQWDPLASYDNCPTAGTGGWVPKSDGTGGQVNGLIRNFYFTTEVRYLFHYDGTPGSLQFYGNDDVWVFVNGQLALDLGATHERLQGNVSIGAGLTAGNTYEIAIFHANTNPRESNFQLTLSGFSTKRSVCTPN